MDISVELSDTELILLWQKHDDKAFEVLYKRYVVKLITIAVHKTGSRDLAEDVVQDVFLNVFLKKGSADQIVNFAAFLHTMIKNRIFDHYRRSLHAKKYKEHISTRFTELDHSTMQIIEKKELEIQLVNQVEKLPLKCRRVYKLSRNKYLPNKEISSLLNISENTVEQHMRKALRTLRASIG